MEDEVVKKIKSKIALAVDVVSDVKEPLQTEAFKIVLSNLLGQINSEDEVRKVDNGKNPIQMNEKSTIYDILAKNTDSTAQIMGLLIDYDEKDDNLSFNLTFDPSQIAISQQDLVLLYLTVKHFGFNVNEEKDVEIRNLLERHKVPVKNLPRNLNSTDKCIVIQGKERTDRTYAITPKGWKKGIEILKRKAQEYA